MVASVPELVKATRSAQGIASTITSAQRTSFSWAMAKTVPLRIARSAASTTTGWAWPRISGP